VGLSGRLAAQARYELLEAALASLSLNLLTQSIAKRDKMRSAETNAVRLVNAEGDGISDLIIDDFAGNWLVQTSSKTAPVLPLIPGSLYWKLTEKGNRQLPVHIAGKKLESPFLVTESGLHFEIDFRSGYSPGLFLDQRNNRSRLRTNCNGRTVLNAFAYTCAFGVAAAVGGASTLNLDLSRHYLDWGTRNYLLNRIDPRNHGFIAGDVFEWLKSFSRRGRRFDIIILDPPTFSRDRKSRVFRVQDDFGTLAKLSVACLSEHGTILCCTNYRAITEQTFVKILKDNMPRKMRFEPADMPPDFPGFPYLKSIWVTSCQ